MAGAGGRRRTCVDAAGGGGLVGSRSIGEVGLVGGTQGIGAVTGGVNCGRGNAAQVIRLLGLELVHELISGVRRLRG